MVVQVYHPTYWAQLFWLIDCILPTWGLNNADKKVLWYPCSIHIQNTECVRYPCILPPPKKIFTLECLGAEYFSKKCRFSLCLLANKFCRSIAYKLAFSSSKVGKLRCIAAYIGPFRGYFLERFQFSWPNGRLLCIGRHTFSESYSYKDR